MSRWLRGATVWGRGWSASVRYKVEVKWHETLEEACIIGEAKRSWQWLLRNGSLTGDEENHVTGRLLLPVQGSGDSDPTWVRHTRGRSELGICSCFISVPGIPWPRATWGRKICFYLQSLLQTVTVGKSRQALQTANHVTFSPRQRETDACFLVC